MFKQIPNEEGSRSKLQIGVFGAARSGKTVYLTTLYWLSKHGKLPDDVAGLLPADAESAGYLGERLAMIEAGQWPKGNVDCHKISFFVSRKNGKGLWLKTNDFKGGDFTAAFYSSSNDSLSKNRAEQFIRDLFAGCSAFVFMVDSDSIRAASESPGSMETQTRVIQQAGAVETTLNLLHRAMWKLSVFHPPVAVVFTKSDQHPECAADPEAYARRHMAPTLNYLKQHAESSPILCGKQYGTN